MKMYDDNALQYNWSMYLLGDTYTQEYTIHQFRVPRRCIRINIEHSYSICNYLGNIYMFIA